MIFERDPKRAAQFYAAAGDPQNHPGGPAAGTTCRAAATFKQYELMKAKGLGELDKSGVAELTFKSRAAEIS